MPKSIIVEGKTTAEAIEKGLKELNATKSMVEIKTVEEEKKRSFYSILAPRVVKIEMTLKENYESDRQHQRVKKEINKNMSEIENVKEKIKECFDAILGEDVTSEVKIENYKGILEYDEFYIKVDTPIGIVSINGYKLTLEQITDEDIGIKGTIKSIELEKD